MMPSPFRRNLTAATSTISSPSGAPSATRSSHLRSAGVDTLIHYPIPITGQPAVASEDPAACPIAARVCREVFSLPLYPALADSAIESIASAVASGPRPALAQPESRP